MRSRHRNKYVTTKDDERISIIARDHDVTVGDLIKANKGRFPGTKLLSYVPLFSSGWQGLTCTHLARIAGKPAPCWLWCFVSSRSKCVSFFLVVVGLMYILVWHAVPVELIVLPIYHINRYTKLKKNTAVLLPQGVEPVGGTKPLVGASDGAAADLGDCECQVCLL